MDKGRGKGRGAGVTADRAGEEVGQKGKGNEGGEGGHTAPIKLESLNIESAPLKLTYT